MDTITLVMYTLFFALTILFSILSIDKHKLEWSLLAMICWWAFAYLNIGLATNNLFIELTWLYFVLGSFFFVLTWRDVYESFQFKRQAKKEDEQWTLEGNVTDD